MSRIVKGGLIQAHNPINDEKAGVEKIKAAALEKHLPLIDEAGKKGVQILCLQEIFNGPYFCPSQDRRWYDTAEAVPGPTTETLAADRQEVPDGDGRPGLRAGAGGRLLQHRRGRSTPTARTSASTARTTSRRRAASGRSTSSSPGNLGYPDVPDALRARSASTSATTATSRRARARSA